MSSTPSYEATTPTRVLVAGLGDTGLLTTPALARRPNLVEVVAISSRARLAQRQ